MSGAKARSPTAPTMPPLRSLAAAVVLMFLGAATAWAQAPLIGRHGFAAPRPTRLFKRMLVKPNDLDAAFRYSEIETKLGDYEAAIGALERMLFYNPNLPRVKLELGLLYFRLHSYEMARSYFNAAIASPGHAARRARPSGEIPRRHRSRPLRQPILASSPRSACAIRATPMPAPTARSCARSARTRCCRASSSARPIGTPSAS